MVTKLRLVAYFGIVMGLLASPAYAAIIAEHQGALEPTTEDVTIWTKNLGYKVTAVADNTSPGSITVNDARTGSSGFFLYSPTPEQIASLASGWKLSANVRVNNDNDAIGDGAVAILFDNVEANQSLMLEYGSYDGRVRIGAQLASNEWNYTTLSTNLSDFVLFEAVYNASAGTIRFYADGIEVLADKSIGFRTTVVAASRLIWGSTSSAGTGSGSYNLVRLETIPEPGTLMILAIGGGMIMRNRQRG